MKELQPNLLNDYKHQVLEKISRHEKEDGFPNLEKYGLTRRMLEDYLYDYQVIIDREGTQRSQLTVYGIIAIVPTVVLSAFPEKMLPWGRWSLLVGIFFGIALSLIIKAVRVGLTKAKLSNLTQSNIDVNAYVAAVELYTNEHK